MYTATALHTASFVIDLASSGQWTMTRPDQFQRYLSMYVHNWMAQIPLSAFRPEAELYQRKNSLVDQILAIAGNVPESEWSRLPIDMAENYRKYGLESKQ